MSDPPARFWSGWSGASRLGPAVSILEFALLAFLVDEFGPFFLALLILDVALFIIFGDVQVSVVLSELEFTRVCRRFAFGTITYGAEGLLSAALSRLFNKIPFVGAFPFGAEVFSMGRGRVMGARCFWAGTSEGREVF